MIDETPEPKPADWWTCPECLGDFDRNEVPVNIERGCRTCPNCDAELEPIW
jgi:hypothetical protein